ncbi:Acg family FMN-binding oxidoreductase [Desulfitobacterium sp. AusDCA]|uniref:Acg family FMN-binding oxidoreductase n=1 Tax=Desulfitobacterium sp. AusDCA TaxID=3240383 RepID=UPI003DA76DF3
MNKKAVRRTMASILSGICVILILAFASLLMISGIFVTPKYGEPWQKDYSQKFDDPRIRLAAHGLLAANGHNMQPWKIRLDKKDAKVFYLYADSERLTKEVDPESRQMMVTQGAFLEYAVTAGDQLGYGTTVELFPEGNYDEQNLAESMKTKPVAKVTLAETKKNKINALYNYMFLPDTNRTEYQATPLTAEQINALEMINTEKDMTIKIYQDQNDKDKLRNYVINGAIVEAGVGRVMKESEVIFRPNEYQKNKYRYGFSVEGQGTSGVMQHVLQGLLTLFPSMNSGKSASDLFIKSTQTSADNTPAYAMIITKDNSRSSQVRSGMLYSRLILNAHSLGLAMQPLSQVLEEYPEMKQLYNGIHHDYASNGGTIQMLFRVGKPTKEVPLSMRRDVMDLIEKD